MKDLIKVLGTAVACTGDCKLCQKWNKDFCKEKYKAIEIIETALKEQEQNQDKLKAFEIIKSCLVSEFKLFEKDGEYLILFYFDEVHELTFRLKDKEEYDLLKRTLHYGK